MRRTLLVFLVGAVLGSAAPAEAQDSWDVKSALKQIDKATKKIGRVTAEVSWSEKLANGTVDGTGTFVADLAGMIRAEVAGNSPRTVLLVPPLLHIYRPYKKLAETYYLGDHPELIVQYTLLGFSPRGSDLKKHYHVKLIREDQVGDRAALLFTLDPKDKQLKAVLSAVQLWIDVETWLPAGQRIVHQPSGLTVEVRYGSMTAADEVSQATFLVDWPEGTDKRAVR